MLLCLPWYTRWAILSKVLGPGLSPRIEALAMVLYSYGYHAWCSSQAPHWGHEGGVILWPSLQLPSSDMLLPPVLETPCYPALWVIISPDQTKVTVTIGSCIFLDTCSPLGS